MKILKAKAVAECTSISVAHLRRMVKAGKFPKPMKISECRSGWLESEVLDWISQCVKNHRLETQGNPQLNRMREGQGND